MHQSYDVSSRREAAELRRPTAKTIHEVVLQEGEEELSRPAAQLAWSGLAAGLAMSLSLVGQGVIKAQLPQAPWSDLVASLGYTLGFLVVVLGRQQLFTENTLTAVIPVLHAPQGARLGKLMKLWTVVLAANLAGTAAFAFAAANLPVVEPPVREAFLALGRQAAAPDFMTLLVRGIVAGWLIALLVWLLPSAGPAQFFIVVMITYFIAAGRFAHVVAGSAEVAFASAAGALPWSEYLHFVLAALLGNITGGTIVVALLNHLQTGKQG
jgi:formate-nitrite transporter family protein